MSLARSTVETVLAEALPAGTVAVDNRATAYNNGRVWVLMGSWSRATEGPGETVAVVVAVAAGQHARLDELVDQVFAALRTDGRCDPTSFDSQYGVNEPVPGRSPTVEGDMARIIVNTPFDR